MMDKEIIFEENGGIGFIILNRPKLLNVLSTQMCFMVDQKLSDWQSASHIQAVVIKGAGDKAFCAGGDVRAVVEQGPDNNISARQFFATEYKMNARIFHFPKPFIALLNGITMGGGVGVSIYGSQRIVCEKTVFAMPEAAIGFIPDVGASYFLPRLVGALGLYLGLTGAHLMGADILYAGLGTAYMNSNKFEALQNELINQDISSDRDVDNIIARFAENPGEAALDQFRDLIDAAFSEKTIEDIIDHLEIIDHQWAKQTLAVLKKSSPLSLKLIMEQLTCGSKLEFNDCMTMEYRIVCAITSYASDFYEGARAILIDKDHNPKWLPKTVEEVSTEMVMAHFEIPTTGDLIF